MERLYLPPSLRYFEPLRTIPREQIGHTSLLYDLVAALAPRLIVDVGTGAGAALSIICQSLRDHDVGGLAYGIDFWEDGERTEDDPEQWTSLNVFLRMYFRGICYLLKMPWAAGLQHFADGSIDILRLNAGRARVPLLELVEAWLPRLAPDGALLCPGVNDPARPDLAADWHKVAALGDGFLFPHGKGLGVLRRATSQRKSSETELLELFASSDPHDREDLARFYEHADRHHALRTEVHGRWAELPRRK